MSKQDPIYLRHDETLIDLLHWRVQHQPDQRVYSFLIDGETDEVHLTYKELDQQARSIAAQLTRLAPTGSRALLVYPPGLEYIAAFFGCLYANMVAVPIYPPRFNRSNSHFQAILEDAQPSIALTTSKLLSNVMHSLEYEQSLQALRWIATDTIISLNEDDWQKPEMTSSSLAFIQYTSGSTSTPKGVILSHSNLLHNLRIISQKLEITYADSGVLWLPPYHDMGLIGGILSALYCDNLLTLMSPASFLQRPLRWLKAISRTRATVSGGPNFAYDLCVQKIAPEHRASLDLSNWQLAFVGAEPIRYETLKRFAEAFESCGFRQEAFYSCYGLAEATLMVSGSQRATQPAFYNLRAEGLAQGRVVVASLESENDPKIVSCGPVALEQHVAIVDPESLTRSHPNHVGEIWLSGPSIARGYWNNSEETEYAFKGYLMETGEGPFLRTGDLGFIKDSELFVVSRMKDLIILRGSNYYPHDIELTVFQSNDLLHSYCGAAFSVDVDGEERLVIAQEVERRYSNANEDEVVRSIREAVAKNHGVHVYAVVLLKPGSIPKTSSGKVRRQACRKAFLTNSLEAVGRSILYDTFSSMNQDSLTFYELLLIEPEERLPVLQEYLKQEVARLLKIDSAQLDPQLPLINLGLDSLMAVEIKNYLEASLGVVVPAESMIDDLSITQIALRVLDQLMSISTQENQNSSIIPTSITTSEEAELVLANIDQLSDDEVSVMLKNMLAD